MRLNDTLRQLRKEKGLTQDQLGERIHVSRATIGKYESGETEVDQNTFDAICNVLNVEPLDLIGDVNRSGL